MPIEARLLPTLDLLLGALGRSIDEIERFPRIFNYSIETLSLRHDFLTEAGKTGRHGLTRTYRSSPYTFATKLAGRSIHEWEAFLRQRALHRAGSPRAADIFYARQAAATAKDESRRAAVQVERERVAKCLAQHAAAGAMEPAEAVEAVSRMLRPRPTPEQSRLAPATAGSAAGEQT
jgi:mTERF domain-containing protein